MRNLYVLFLFLVSLLMVPSFTVAIASAPVTSIKIQDKIYNLLVLDQGEFPAAIKIINQAKGFSSKFQENSITEPIDNCDFMIDLPVGTVTGNHSYGGYCQTKVKKGVKSKYMLACGDIMVGHFKAELIEDFLNSPREINVLAAFVAENCTGG